MYFSTVNIYAYTHSCTCTFKSHTHVHTHTHTCNARRYTILINMLHSGVPCTSCGLRFKSESAEEYRHHLDWHYQMNRQEREGTGKTSRNWYMHPEVGACVHLCLYLRSIINPKPSGNHPSAAQAYLYEPCKRQTHLDHLTLKPS